MRPTEAQHRAALALHAGRTERFVRGELTPDEWRPIRLSYGLYYQLDHTSHMQRIKIPGGMLTAEQMEAMAEVADRYGRGIAQVTVNDIGLYAKVRDGARGFSLHAGGGLGAQPFLAKPMRDFLPADDLLVWCEAIVRVQHRFGERKNRNRARMKYLVQRMGLEKFRAAAEGEAERVAAERGRELRAQVREAVATYRVPPAPDARRAPARQLPEFAHWKRTNTRAQKQPGYRAALVQVPLGDITADQMRAVARLARVHGNGTIRTTNDQNLVLQWIPQAALPALHAGLVEIELGNPDVTSINDVVSCPGMDYCSLAITRSMGMAERIRAHLAAHPESSNGFAERLGPFTVKISGCPNSCGQHHVGDIGLTGHLAKTPDGGEIGRASG